MELIVAFSTNDGVTMIKEHAGQAKYFDVYRISSGDAKFLEQRDNAKYKGDETLKHGDSKKAQATLGALEGVHVLAARMYGPNLPKLLKKLLCVVIRDERIASSVEIIRENFARVWDEYQKGEARKHLILKP